MHKRFFGGDGEEATPVPIPNTEVKLFSADGTAWEAVWESRTLPKIFSASPPPETLGRRAASFTVKRWPRKPSSGYALSDKRMKKVIDSKP